MKKPNLCRICGNSGFNLNLLIVGSFSGPPFPADRVYYHVQCSNCGECGPPAEDKSESIEKWNDLNRLKDKTEE